MRRDTTPRFRIENLAKTRLLALEPFYFPWALRSVVLLGSLLLANPVHAEPVRIRIGSKALTEGVILGEMLTLLAEHAGAAAEHRAALGGTQIVFKALQTGDIDAYADYTGTITQELLHGQSVRNDDQMREALEKLGIGMSARLGFNNTYAIGMKEEIAEHLQIRSIADLGQHPTLRVGLSDEFLQRNDGWPGLKQSYRLPQTPTGMEHNLAYRALEANSIDVTDLNSTDAEIRFHKLRVLTDDRGYFPQYFCVILYRRDLPERAPQVFAAFQNLAGHFDDSTMIELNARAKLDRVPERVVAADYLRSKFGLTLELERDSWVDRLATTTWDHICLVIVSLSAAVVMAVPLGIAAAKLPAQFGQLILGVIGVVQTIPSMAILVFMIPLLGIGYWPAIMALFLYSLLPIVRNTYSGLVGMSPALKESAEVLGLPAAARLWRIELPLASPMILAGIKTAAVINVGTATIGALIGAGGYGQPILNGIRLNNTRLILQGAVPAAVLAILVQLLFELVERRCVPKGLRAGHSR